MFRFLSRRRHQCRTLQCPSRTAQPANGTEPAFGSKAKSPPACVTRCSPVFTLQSEIRSSQTTAQTCKDKKFACNQEHKSFHETPLNVDETFTVLNANDFRVHVCGVDPQTSSAPPPHPAAAAVKPRADAILMQDIDCSAKQVRVDVEAPPATCDITSTLREQALGTSCDDPMQGVDSSASSRKRLQCSLCTDGTVFCTEKASENTRRPTRRPRRQMLVIGKLHVVADRRLVNAKNPRRLSNRAISANTFEGGEI
jgi:hypothetical protein